MDEYDVRWTTTARDDLKLVHVLAVLDARRDLSNVLLERTVRR